MYFSSIPSFEPIRPYQSLLFHHFADGRRATRTFLYAPAAPPYHQPFLAVEPVDFLVVHGLALACPQPTQPPIAEAPALCRQLPQPLAHRLSFARRRS